MARNIVVHILGDSTDLQRAFKTAGGSAEGFGKKLGTVAKAGIGAAFAAVGLGAAKAINDASNLSEQLNKTAVVFGKSGDEMVGWSKNLTRNFGLSQRAALEASGTFGNMLVPMGIARDKAAKMSRGLVQLAGDMASFNNASPEETLEAIRSGLAGETEPLRRFGVFLNEDRIKAEALSLGLAKMNKDTTKVKVAHLNVSKALTAHTKNIKKYGPAAKEAQESAIGLEVAQDRLTKALAGTNPKLTAQQKALAINSLILKDTKDAAGDFEETSGSLANQQRILRAEFENVSAKLGTKLLPIMTKLMNFTIRFITWSEENWPKFRKAVTDAFVKIRPYLLRAQKFVQELWQTIQGVVDLVAGIFQGDWDRAWKGANQVVGDAVKAMIAVITTIPRKVITALAGLAWRGLEEIGERIADGIMAGLEGLKNRILKLLQWVIDKVNAVTGPIRGIAGKAGINVKKIPDVVDKNPGIKDLPGTSAGRVRPGLSGDRPATRVESSARTGSVTIIVNGAKNPEETGRAVLRHIQRATGHTATPRRGPNAGTALATG